MNVSVYRPMQAATRSAAVAGRAKLQRQSWWPSAVAQAALAMEDEDILAELLEFDSPPKYAPSFVFSRVEAQFDG